MIEFKIGLVFYDNKHCFIKKKYHIINVFEHGGEVLITYKFYVKSRQRWFFKTEFDWELGSSFEYGNFKLTK